MSAKDSINIAKKYKINSLIGKGGFSEVYKVQYLNDANSDIYYALKYAKVAENADVVAAKKRFLQETQIYKKIQSNKVAKFIECYIDENEQYIVMEYVDGKTIKDFLRQNQKIPAKLAVNYASEIASGIHELHSSKIIHRDIKSHNIMITKDRKIKIIDFGLALDDSSQRYTRENSIIGSPFYMAPELTTFKSQPSVKSDIYALGILLYEMITGEYPVKEQNAQQTIMKQRQGIVQDLAKNFLLPQPVINCIIRATAIDPNKRYKSMWEFKKDLDTAYDSKRACELPLDLKKIETKKTFGDFINTKTFIYTSIVLCVLILLAGIALITWLTI
ncbi:serine/threonine-protein kinase [Mycoplasmopsis gallinarum]|uniref:Serine/threonine protein kinase n=1 Tax=Mycoplasmopsis gallinarum TaxID=29557 RepID=A0A168RFS4_9BACT|nr:serine/threonine-protein kinase [Mycoplasmopsis gallinarum]OAB48939.1 Serine/threonine protein kinase [Mycoplasmopsis gallinarum]